ncbi:hypothetical protein [Micromonospora sp. NPDC005254]|uniref:hypothetical protein n=1 Tax=Micromonospora sp. NPDC005254 TaxID=3364229 RepID=UPI003690FF8F
MNYRNGIGAVLARPARGRLTRRLALIGTSLGLAMMTTLGAGATPAEAGSWATGVYVDARCPVGQASQGLWFSSPATGQSGWARWVKPWTYGQWYGFGINGGWSDVKVTLGCGANWANSYTAYLAVNQTPTQGFVVDCIKSIPCLAYGTNSRP